MVIEMIPQPKTISRVRVVSSCHLAPNPLVRTEFWFSSQFRVKEMRQRAKNLGRCVLATNKAKNIVCPFEIITIEQQKDSYRSVLLTPAQKISPFYTFTGLQV